MKYWAKNGEYNWICNTQEYNGSTSGYDYSIDSQSENNVMTTDSESAVGVMHKVEKTYMVTNFWNNYDGTQSPLDGKAVDKETYPSGYVNGFAPTNDTDKAA